MANNSQLIFDKNNGGQVVGGDMSISGGRDVNIGSRVGGFVSEGVFKVVGRIGSSLTTWIDGEHMVLGQVLEGVGVIKAIEKVGSSSGRTSKPVVVADCGQLS